MLDPEEGHGGFLKWWYPTTMGFPTKNDHFGVFRGYHHLRKHPHLPLVKTHVIDWFLGICCSDLMFEKSFHVDNFMRLWCLSKTCKAQNHRFHGRSNLLGFRDCPQLKYLQPPAKTSARLHCSFSPSCSSLAKCSAPTRLWKGSQLESLNALC